MANTVVPDMRLVLANVIIEELGEPGARSYISIYYCLFCD